MNKKILIVIAIFIVVGIVAIFTLSFSEQTTQINNKILNGTVQGVVVEDNSSIFIPDWGSTYNDTENGIYYEFLMADSFNFTAEGALNLMNGQKVVTKEYNGVKWDVYYLVPGPFNVEYQNGGWFISQSGYLCFASGKNGDYMIAISSGGVHSNSSMDTDLFENYLEPLLNNITLKDPQNPPKEYQFLNSTKEDYDLISNYAKQNGWDEIKNI